jgi:hypothetical protein
VIVSFAERPTRDLVERHFIEDPFPAPRRELELPPIQDPPIGHEPRFATPCDDLLARLQRRVQEGISFREPSGSFLHRALPETTPICTREAPLIRRFHGHPARVALGVGPRNDAPIRPRSAHLSSQALLAILGVRGGAVR